ncbi:MAG: ABC transporter ATP-binding protein, partial [Bacteroidota bacterium]
MAPLDRHAFLVENVSFGYETGAPVLRDVSFTVKSGEFLSIIGPNGSGKTTLLRLLDRILIPHKGRIVLEHSNLQKLSRA